MKIKLLLVMLCFSTALFAQTPNSMSFQAIVRDGSNALITSEQVSLSVLILKDSANGNPDYWETHAATTNTNGLLTVEVGTGTPTIGTFGAIDWAQGTYFIKTVIIGNTFTATAVTQIMSVPYALHAETAQIAQIADTVLNESDPKFLQHVASSVVPSDTAYWNNKIDVEIDGDPTNEFQNLRLNNSLLSLTNSLDTVDLSLVEVDPVFNNSIAFGITSADTALWNTTTGAISTETDPVFNSSVAAGITSIDTAYWNNKIDYEVDGSVFNELQYFHVENNWLKLIRLPDSVTIDSVDVTPLVLTNEGDPIFNASLAAGITSVDTAYWNNKVDVELDGDPSNEFQDLTLTGTDLSLTNSLVDIDLSPIINANETDPLFNASVAAGITTLDTAYWNSKLDVELDGDSTNEFQDLSLTNNLLSLSNSLDSIDLGAVVTANEGDPIFNASIAAGITAVDTAYWNNKVDVELDADPTNEIQNLELVGSLLTISNNTAADTVDLSLFNTDNQVSQGQVITWVRDYGFDTLEVDGDITNELQNINEVLVRGNVADTSMRIRGILDPAWPQDVATKNYVDNNIISQDLPSVLSFGNIADTSLRIRGVMDPAWPQDVATKNYVDNNIISQDLSSVLINGNVADTSLRIRGILDPAWPQDVATKNYVDAKSIPDLGTVLGIGNNAGNIQISNLGYPVASADAATKGYVDAVTLADVLNGVGSDAGMDSIINLVMPSIPNDFDAVNRAYVDAQVGAISGLSSVVATDPNAGGSIVGLVMPSGTDPFDAANRGYVDGRYTADSANGVFVDGTTGVIFGTYKAVDLTMVVNGREIRGNYQSFDSTIVFQGNRIKGNYKPGNSTLTMTGHLIQGNYQGNDGLVITGNQIYGYIQDQRPNNTTRIVNGNEILGNYEGHADNTINIVNTNKLQGNYQGNNGLVITGNQIYGYIADQRSNPTTTISGNEILGNYEGHADNTINIVNTNKLQGNYQGNDGLVITGNQIYGYIADQSPNPTTTISGNEILGNYQAGNLTMTITNNNEIRGNYEGHSDNTINIVNTNELQGNYTGGTPTSSSSNISNIQGANGTGIRIEGNEIREHHYQIGDFAHGGIVFYVDETGEHGLVVNLQNMNSNTTMEWAHDDANTLGAFDYGLYGGHDNSIIMLSQDAGNSGDWDTYNSAYKCLSHVKNSQGGIGGWYLPSIGELYYIHLNETIVNTELTNNSGISMNNEIYWSSTEWGDNNANAYSFNAALPATWTDFKAAYDLNTYQFDKTNTYKARPIRRF